MGGGKSTILQALLERRVICVPEPARKILSEQRSIQGTGVPEIDPSLFTMLMLSRAIHDYSLQDSAGVVFDRGVPDMVAYAGLFELDLRPYKAAAEKYRYNENVFYFPPWEEIYSTDEERKIDFEGAKNFGIQTKRIYQDLGYNVIEVPRIPITERADFILSRIKELLIV